jgi:SNF2 family DNA or RNA helicase
MYCTAKKRYDIFVYEFENIEGRKIEFEYMPAIEDIRDFILEQLAKEMPEKTEEEIEQMLTNTEFFEEQMKEYNGDLEEYFEAAAQEEFDKEKYWEVEDEDY